MVELDSYFQPDPRIVSQALPEEAVLLVPDKGEVKVLNDVGARIWTLLDGSRTVREIAAQISREYEAPEAEAEVDTRCFIAELLQREMIHVRP